jgi:hypothetical protein
MPVRLFLIVVRPRSHPTSLAVPHEKFLGIADGAMFLMAYQTERHRSSLEPMTAVCEGPPEKGAILAQANDAK